MNKWEQVFICSCGYAYYHYKYMGNHDILVGICPECGSNMRYAEKVVRRSIRRKNAKPFCFWKPSTWFVGYEYEYKED